VQKNQGARKKIVTGGGEIPGTWDLLTKGLSPRKGKTNKETEGKGRKKKAAGENHHLVN